MNNKVVNKQIPLKTIIDIANYFEDYKERYKKIFEQENVANKNKQYSERNFEHENGNAEVKYTVELHNGKNMTESDYNWFIQNTNEPRLIKSIYIAISVSYYTKSNDSDYNNEYNKISASVEFRDCVMNLNYSDTIVNVDTTNQENEAHNIYSTIMNTLENNEDRFNKTIKNRKVRIQSFCISVGIILSYILYFILLINKTKLPDSLSSYLTNKFVIVFGQWFIAIILGNSLSYWYILSLYKPLLPESKYTGYNSSSNKSVYTDDIDDYINHSEVHFGKYWDAEQRRKKIEKIYKITKWIVLAQLLISAIMFFIIK